MASAGSLMKALLLTMLLSAGVIWVSAQDSSNAPYLVVLGVAQDAGYPQAGCYQAHCLPGWRDPSLQKDPVSLGLVDPSSKQKFLFEATPSMPRQFYQLNQLAPDSDYSLAGIFLTHAHIGHYSGLMYLGHEAMGASQTPVFVMPRMHEFLSTNGPWDQLVRYKNIRLEKMANGTANDFDNIKVTPFLVPHRDEYSETVGYRIDGPNKSAVFIPDINKWSAWKTDLIDVVKSVDYAFLDASFFADGELPGRDMSKIPHPLVTDTMRRLAGLDAAQRNKVWFIHFNHTNPLLRENSTQSQLVRDAGFNVAVQGLELAL